MAGTTPKASRRRTGNGAVGDRAATEALIERTALELLADSGVLAGLNLREVADRANLNRGLVYLYFGSRQALLRSALSKRAESAPIWNDERREADPPAERLAHDLLEVARAEDQVKLHALLHLDGAPDLRAMPYLREALAILQQDIDDARLPAETDIEALHVLWVSLCAGYSLFRDRFATELGASPDDVDARVSNAAAQLLESATKPTTRTKKSRRAAGYGSRPIDA